MSRRQAEAWERGFTVAALILALCASLWNAEPRRGDSEPLRSLLFFPPPFEALRADAQPLVAGTGVFPPFASGDAGGVSVAAEAYTLFALPFAEVSPLPPFALALGEGPSQALSTAAAVGASTAARAARAGESSQAKEPAKPAGSGPKGPPGKREVVPGGLQWPLRGRVSSKFGKRWGAWHRGIDIAMSPGTPIRAAAAGVVRDVSTEGDGRMNGYGNVVVIDHGGGVSTLYSHCAKISVKRGQRVDKGAVVGTVGRTGRTTGYCLHFEVRLRDKPVDPLKYLPGVG